MRTRKSLFAAVALAAAFALPHGAAGQGLSSPPSPLPQCVDCFLNAGWTFFCRAGPGGGGMCTVSSDGQRCTVSGPCYAAAAPVPIDGVANSTARVPETSGTEDAFALVASAGEGRRQYRARCNGVVLARAYSVAMADQLRGRTAVITL